MAQPFSPHVKILALLVACAFGGNTGLHSAPTQISNEPLANASNTGKKPNLMFILDDSGSMQQDATPDYVQQEKLCKKSGDNTSGDTFEYCRLGDPPYMSAEFNYQYYNPATRYVPALNADGTSMTTYLPTAVSTDPFGVRTWNQFYQYGNVATVNLLTEYPDRAWCINSTDANTDLVNCRVNGASGTNGWLYPDPNFDRSRDSGRVGRCNNAYPNDSPPAPDYDCSTGAGNNVQFPKYRFGAPYYYNVIPTEHCTDSTLATCVFSETPTTVASVNYNVPAKIRWCSNTALTTCQARKDGTFRYLKLNFIGAQASATITVGGSSGTNTVVTSVKVNGVEVMGVATAGSTTNSTIAQRIVDNINTLISVPEFVATRSGSQVTIRAVAPNSSNGATITVTSTGGARTFTTTVFGGAGPGTKMQRVNIVPAVTSYPKAAGRTDCAGATCTYAEEIANFTNWYAYYRTRMLMIKSAAGRAFASLDQAYRIGFITINPGNPVQASRYLSVDDFASGAGGQKVTWYSKLYGTGFNGSTPLREALSRVGRYFGNVTTGINSGMAASPIQFGCQQNFTILSTDGYWNGNAGQDLTGGSIGNRDNSLGNGANQVPRPLYDGGDAAATNTLADVAAYFYATDLRTDLDNEVPTTPKDPASHQHMTTFTIGLGLAGRLLYEGNYETSTTGDFQKLKQGTLNWPVPTADTETALDDLWHAAVNGRGQFFSARDPEQVVDGINTALSALQARTGAGAAAATSNLQPVAGDNFAFTPEYTTQRWTGDLKARSIDLNTGIVSSTILWSAQTQLEGQAHASRTIFTATTDTGTYPSGLKSFEWTASSTTLTAAEQAYFNTNKLGQYAGWTTGQRTTATARSLVNYLRGEKTYYNTEADPALDTDLYRPRDKILGDIINAQPSYVKGSPLTYNDVGHDDFVKCTLGTGGTPCPSGLTGSTARIGTIYGAANDGMLHAFETQGVTAGQERWAFIPSLALPNMYQLANNNYKHIYTVDGSPVVGDICVAANCKAASVTPASWRSVLVAGLNGGGRGYYALDVTNPAANQVKLLWEFKVRDPAVTACNAAVVGTNTDCDLGYTYGNPIITKRESDGKWIVLVTSGYNNINPGSGKGFLYVLDAVTGLVLNKVALPAAAGGVAGTALPLTCLPATLLPITPYCNADPVGLGKIEVLLRTNENDNTAIAVYGGDLKGRLWRFDISSATNAYPDAFLIASLTDGTNPQPITTRPITGKIKGTQPMVFIATGKYLGEDDPTNTQKQTLYALKADATTSITNPRGGSLVQQNIGVDEVTAGLTVRRQAVCNTVDLSNKSGWYVDFPVSGERSNVDGNLTLGTLTIPTNLPTGSACSGGGTSYVNNFNYENGCAVSTADGVISTKLSSQTVGVNTIRLPGNKIVTIATTADNKQLTLNTPTSLGAALGGRRVSWKELVTE